MKRISLLIFVMIMTATSVALLAQESKLPPLLDRELFFDNPEISGGQLSPDGKFISFVKPYNGVMNIWVKTLEEPFASARPLTADKQRPVRSYFWSRDGKYILYVQDKGGDENFNIYAVNPSEKAPVGAEVPENRDLTNLKGVRVQIYSVPKTDPDAIYIGLNDRDPAWHDLYRMKLSTGERTLIRQNSGEDRITGWIFDWNDQLRLAMRANADGSNDILRVDDNGFTAIYTTSVFETAYPVAFDKDNKRIYLVTNKGDDVDLTRLILLDPETLKEEFVEADPLQRVDLGDVAFSDLRREIIYTSYEDDRNRLYWKDKDFEADYKRISEQLPGVEPYFARTTADERFWIIGAYSDVDPGTTYLFDRETKKLTFQYRPRPNIPVEHMANMQAIRYPSSDGLEIPAYLTLPKGVEPKNLPVIVMPHGGPWARSGWGFNSYAQFLANRGYAVLDPNFRASTGYGKKFINAGNKEWGRKMQDDITWGIKYLVKQGIADPAKVAIMGGSYGGYATLAGLAFTPDVYACGVSIVGPSNLITLLNSIPPYWESIRTVFHKRMGDPSTPEGEADLKKMSPLFSADKIKSPLLVVQGANDPRVKQHESDQIVVALRDRGFPVEYIVAPDEGHGFARPVNNMAMLAAAEKFLARHLGGRYQESMKPEVAERLKEITVDPKTVMLKSSEK
ncbi:MAG: S9 family peptidase [Lentimicrobium sp.]|uniref:S9 family peptidase n=3 Tax=Lentimicrobium sp. TaxID=2034841 RepID=UPI0025DC1AD4|nr:S9 family peptidase [Lentimicrobium sp.]MCO5258477.1 S9 family peptidase [Lentimicrobium sp.]